MAGDITGAHGKLKTGFEELSGELLRTIAEWGEGTSSRAAYDGFKKRVDNLFDEMHAALAKMPPVVRQAADESEHTEKANAARFGG